MQIILLGSNGQLGWELARTLQCLGNIHSFSRQTLDVTDIPKLRATIQQINPDAIINASAYTAVDKAEEEVDLAMAVNATAPQIIAEEAKKTKAAFIHFSTDYVFDGKKQNPFTETDPVKPINKYGLSKLEGERLVQDVDGAFLILRTSWVYSLRKTSFVSKVIEWAKKKETLKIVTDQIGSPTWCRMLAESTAQILAKPQKSDLYSWFQNRKGIYNLTNQGQASRLELAQFLIEEHPDKKEFACKKILPATSDEFNTAAIRPVNSVLNCEKFINTFALHPPHWKESLRLAMIK